MPAAGSLSRRHDTSPPHASIALQLHHYAVARFASDRDARTMIGTTACHGDGLGVKANPK
eukprot:8119665-Pyramimonas_sp.AAC.1